jgi:hypothetical protein
MCKRLVLLLVGLVLVAAAAAAAPAWARPLEGWSYERLFKEADVVVLARPESVADVDVKPKDARMREGFLGRVTTFSVVNAIKGEVKGKTIDVLHFRMKEGLASADGPLLIQFRTKPVRIEGKSGGDGKRAATAFAMELAPPDYLLFLKRGENGRLEPVSGQYDPALSVREVSPPMPDFLGDR